MDSTSAEKEQEGRVDFQPENKSEEVVFVLRLLAKTKLQKGRNCKHPLPRAFRPHYKSVPSVMPEERGDLSTHSFWGFFPAHASLPGHLCCLSHSKHCPGAVLPSTHLLCCCNLQQELGGLWPPSREAWAAQQISTFWKQDSSRFKLYPWKQIGGNWGRGDSLTAPSHGLRHGKESA